jgi:hypothetical protein
MLNIAHWIIDSLMLWCLVVCLYRLWPTRTTEEAACIETTLDLAIEDGVVLRCWRNSEGWDESETAFWADVRSRVDVFKTAQDTEEAETYTDLVRDLIQFEAMAAVQVMTRDEANEATGVVAYRSWP